MGINIMGVATHALSLLVSSRVLTEKEVTETSEKGYEELVELLKEKGELYRNDFNERVGEKDQK